MPNSETHPTYGETSPTVSTPQLLHHVRDREGGRRRPKRTSTRSPPATANCARPASAPPSNASPPDTTPPATPQPDGSAEPAPSDSSHPPDTAEPDNTTSVPPSEP